MNLLNSKKAQFSNYMVVILFLVMFSMVNIIAMLLLTEIRDGYKNATAYYYPEVNTAFDSFLKSIALMDYVLVIVVFVLIIGIILTSFKINTSPAFFVISIIGGIFFIFVSLFFNVFFKMVVSESIFSSVLVYFPLTIFLGSNLQWVALVTFIVGSIALYAKRDKGEFVR